MSDRRQNYQKKTIIRTGRLFVLALSLVVLHVGSAMASCGPDAAKHHAQAAYATPTAQDVTYATVDGINLTLDVFAPADGATHPSLLVIHGGSWRAGCKEKVWDEATKAAQAGFVAFAVDYRLACDRAANELCGYQSPAQLDDVRAALTWVRANAATYGGDPTEVGAIGFSAGGHLSYMLGATGTAGADRVDAAAGLSGVADMAYPCIVNPDGNVCGIRENFIGCDVATCPDAWIAMSPVSQVTTAAAPMYVANSIGEGLVKYEEALELTNALTSVGVVNQLCSVQGGAHAESTEDLSCNEIPDGTVLGNAFAFLKAHLTGAASRRISRTSPDVIGPRLTVVGPSSVIGSRVDALVVARDLVSGVSSLTVNGKSVVSGHLALIAGKPVSIVARDHAGNRTTLRFQIDSLPPLATFKSGALDGARHDQLRFDPSGRAQTGMRAWLLRAVQTRLIALGYLAHWQLTSTYSMPLLRTVERFQHAVGIGTALGTIGPSTRLALDKAIAKRITVKTWAAA